MNRLTVHDLDLVGLKLVERQNLSDTRGFLERLFCIEELRSAGWNRPIAQVNHTYTARKGTVRGLHFQCAPHSESKLVSCIRGEVWDVAVDLRRDSPTFLHWHAEPLTAGNHRSLLIPEGYAHGFQALSDDVEMIYCHSAAYAADAENGVNPSDPRLAIAWPLPIASLSARDISFPQLDDSFAGVTS